MAAIIPTVITPKAIFLFLLRFLNLSVKFLKFVIAYPLISTPSKSAFYLTPDMPPQIYF